MFIIKYLRANKWNNESIYKVMTFTYFEVLKFDYSKQFIKKKHVI